MVADIAERERAEDRIAQCMDDDIAIRMRDDALIMRNVDAAEHDVIAGAECVDVDALADAHGWSWEWRLGMKTTRSSSRRKPGSILIFGMEAGRILAFAGMTAGWLSSRLPTPESRHMPQQELRQCQ